MSRMMIIDSVANFIHIVKTAGIYEGLFELGATIEAGQKLGQVHFVDNPSRAPEQIIAQCSGVLMGVRGPSFVSMGDCVGVIAQKLEGELLRVPPDNLP